MYERGKVEIPQRTVLL